MNGHCHLLVGLFITSFQKDKKRRNNPFQQTEMFHLIDTDDACAGEGNLEVTHNSLI